VAVIGQHAKAGERARQLRKMLLPRQLDPGDVRFLTVDWLDLREALVDATGDRGLEILEDGVGHRLVEDAGLHHADRLEKPFEEHVEVVRARRHRETAHGQADFRFQ
jgi:hypothetical protein